jgi:NAD-dependent dihydropyrimidine dehydrogenase PreA subunit
MAQTWYPIINENLCTSCNSCVDFCTHGVYENGDLYPKVVNPDNCVEFCRGCSKICPSEAITYFGDTENK